LKTQTKSENKHFSHCLGKKDPVKCIIIKEEPPRLHYWRKMKKFPQWKCNMMVKKNPKFSKGRERSQSSINVPISSIKNPKTSRSNIRKISIWVTHNLSTSQSISKSFERVEGERRGFEIVKNSSLENWCYVTYIGLWKCSEKNKFKKCCQK